MIDKYDTKLDYFIANFNEQADTNPFKRYLAKQRKKQNTCKQDQKLTNRKRFDLKL